MRISQMVALLFWLTAASVPAVAQNAINSDHVATANCIRNVLRSDPSVGSIELYRIDWSRSAVEFTFHDEKYGSLVGDIELNGNINGDMGFEMPIFGTDAPPSAAMDFVSRLQMAQKCSMTSALDDVIPLPKPRAEWQRVEWPSPSPSPTP